MHTSRPISELRRALATGELSARELVENALTTAVWRKTQGAKQPSCISIPTRCWRSSLRELI